MWGQGKHGSEPPRQSQKGPKHGMQHIGLPRSGLAKLPTTSLPDPTPAPSPSPPHQGCLAGRSQALGHKQGGRRSSRGLGLHTTRGQARLIAMRAMRVVRVLAAGTSAICESACLAHCGLMRAAWKSAGANLVIITATHSNVTLHPPLSALSAQFPEGDLPTTMYL